MKYQNGDCFDSLPALVEWLEQGGSIMVHGHYTHYGWAMSWQLHYMKSLVSRGLVYKAEKKSEKKD